MEKLFEQQRYLVSKSGASGFEHEVLEAIKKRAEPYADDIHYDALGSLIVHKKGTGKRLALLAHCDAVGIMITGIRDDGLLEIQRIGWPAEEYFHGKRVRFNNGTLGVVANSDIDKCKGSKSGYLNTQNFLIDIGASSREEAEQFVQEGDSCVYEGTTEFLLDGRAVGPYFDDLVGCNELLSVLQSNVNTKLDVYYIFAVQEEVGVRGSKTASWAVNPDYGIALDTFPIGDDPTESQRADTALSKGPAMMIMDGSTICDPGFTRWIEQVAVKHNIKTQRYVMDGAGSDAMSIQRTRAGVVTAQIDTPVRHAHQPIETADFSDIQGAVNLLCAILEELE